MSNAKFTDLSGPVIARIDQGIEMGLELNVGFIFPLTQKIVPEASGNLKDSGSIVREKWNGMPFITIQYGDEKTIDNNGINYSKYQYYGDNLNHPDRRNKDSKRGRKSRWIERVTDTHQARLRNQMVAAMAGVNGEFRNVSQYRTYMSVRPEIINIRDSMTLGGM